MKRIAPNRGVLEKVVGGDDFQDFRCLTEVVDFVKHNPRVILRFFWSERRTLLLGTAKFSMDCEGPPGGAHGASIALVFDEILAYPVWRSHDESSFTGSMTVSYRKMVPVGSTQAFEAKIVRQDGRKSFVAGKLMSCDGKVIFAEATGVWIQSQQLDSISRRSHL